MTPGESFKGEDPMDAMRWMLPGMYAVMAAILGLVILIALLLSGPMSRARVMLLQVNGASATLASLSRRTLARLVDAILFSAPGALPFLLRWQQPKRW